MTSKGDVSIDCCWQWGGKVQRTDEGKGFLKRVGGGVGRLR